MTTQAQDYPFARELITDTQGRIVKVVLEIADYQKLLEALEMEGLYRAMNEVRGEVPMSLEAALRELEQA